MTRHMDAHLLTTAIFSPENLDESDDSSSRTRLREGSKKERFSLLNDILYFLKETMELDEALKFCPDLEEIGFDNAEGVVRRLLRLAVAVRQDEEKAKRDKNPDIDAFVKKTLKKIYKDHTSTSEVSAEEKETEIEDPREEIPGSEHYEPEMGESEEHEETESEEEEELEDESDEDEDKDELNESFSKYLGEGWLGNLVGKKAMDMVVDSAIRDLKLTSTQDPMVALKIGSWLSKNYPQLYGNKQQRDTITTAIENKVNGLKESANSDWLVEAINKMFDEDTETPRRLARVRKLRESRMGDLAIEKMEQEERLNAEMNEGVSSKRSYLFKDRDGDPVGIGDSFTYLARENPPLEYTVTIERIKNRVYLIFNDGHKVPFTDFFYAPTDRPLSKKIQKIDPEDKKWLQYHNSFDEATENDEDSKEDEDDTDPEDKKWLKYHNSFDESVNSDSDYPAEAISIAKNLIDGVGFGEFEEEWDTLISTLSDELEPHSYSYNELEDILDIAADQMEEQPVDFDPYEYDAQYRKEIEGSVSDLNEAEKRSYLFKDKDGEPVGVGDSFTYLAREKPPLVYTMTIERIKNRVYLIFNDGHKVPFTDFFYGPVDRPLSKKIQKIDSKEWVEEAEQEKEIDPEDKKWLHYHNSFDEAAGDRAAHPTAMKVAKGICSKLGYTPKFIDGGVSGYRVKLGSWTTDKATGKGRSVDQREVDTLQSQLNALGYPEIKAKLVGSKYGHFGQDLGFIVPYDISNKLAAPDKEYSLDSLEKDISAFSKQLDESYLDGTMSGPSDMKSSTNQIENSSMPQDDNDVVLQAAAEVLKDKPQNELQDFLATLQK